MDSLRFLVSCLHKKQKPVRGHDFHIAFERGIRGTYSGDS
jgi:hypothetical protein